MGEMDPASAALVDKINALLNEAMTFEGDVITEMRSLASKMFTAFSGPDYYQDIKTNDIAIPGHDANIPARIYSNPDSQTKPLPMVVYFHGGGWALGGLDDYDILLKSISAQSGVNILSVDYRLAPEFPFPNGLEDAQTALEYALNSAAELNADPSRIAVMGDSAGGNLASVLAQSPINKGKLLAQFLLYPMLDVSAPHETYPSRIAYGNGAHFLTRAAIDKSVEDYTGGQNSLDNPRISPLMAKSHKDVPPTYIMVGNCDPLRDESFAFAEKLARSDIDVQIDCIPGAIHAFLSFGCLEDVQAYRTKLAKNIQRRLSLD